MTNIFVGNLSYQTTEGELEAMFAPMAQSNELPSSAIGTVVSPVGLPSSK